MKNILFLVSSMEGGGAERVAALLSNQWVSEGHQVTLMPTFSGRGGSQYRLHERVKLDFLADRVGFTGQSPIRKIRRLYALRRAIREIKPDVIVSFLAHVNVAALIATIGIKTPVIVSERIHPPAFKINKLLYLARKWLYPTANVVVLQTETSKKWMQRHCPQARLEVIPNPVVWPLPVGEPAAEPDTLISPAKQIVIGVGRLDPQKGFEDLLNAFALIEKRFPDWDLVILGEGSQYEALMQQCQTLALTDRIHIPGRMGNMSDWYERAGVYVMSSRFEGFPNTLIEAMSHSLPAVSYDCETGPKDIITDKVNGLLVKPEAGVKGLSAAMATLMEDSSKRISMGKSAAAVQQRFTMEKISDHWNTVFDECCHE